MENIVYLGQQGRQDSQVWTTSLRILGFIGRLAMGNHGWILIREE